MAISCQGSHFPTEVMLMRVRQYMAYPMHLLRQGQLEDESEQGLTAAAQFYSPAAYFLYQQGWLTSKQLYFFTRTRKR